MDGYEAGTVDGEGVGREGDGGRGGRGRRPSRHVSCSLCSGAGVLRVLIRLICLDREVGAVK